MTKFTLVALFCITSACNASGSKSANQRSTAINGAVLTTLTDEESKYDTTNTMNKYFPFELQANDGSYSIMANIEGAELYPKYVDFFESHDYTGNGYTWEGICVQILKQLDPSLLKHIQFDPEAGGFYATADSKEAQVKFAELLSPIFNDTKKLEEWLKKIDRSQVDD